MPLQTFSPGGCSTSGHYGKGKLAFGLLNLSPVWSFLRQKLPHRLYDPLPQRVAVQVALIEHRIRTLGVLAFGVITGILAYRSRYLTFLKIDFPRLPLTGNLDLFRELGRLGGDLVALHLMESPKLDHFITTYTGPKNPEIGRVSWLDGTVWLDAVAAKKGQPTKPGTMGFRGVPEAVWNFRIGSYQICEKWLKDHKGRTLSDDDIAHYRKIVVALNETIRLMQEIEEVIAENGGWPDAFADRICD